MPAGQGKDAERFAAAVEQGTPPGFAGDDDLARELEIVAMLRSAAGSAFAPDPDAKARARQRLMAVVAEQGGQHRGGPVAPPTAVETTAPMGRVLEPPFPTPRTEIDTAAETTQFPSVARHPSEGEHAEADDTDDTAAGTRTAAPVGRSGRRARHSVTSRPAGRAGASRRPAPSMRRRVALVSTAALVMMIALTGGALVASRDALPGDNLYTLKRVAESAELALTFDETARAQRHLQFAATRLSEVEQLVARNSGTVDPQVYTAAIQEFDSATGEGSRVLLSAAETGSGQADTTQLDALHNWVTQQAARLTELRPALPLPAAADADGSIQLLDVLLGRTEALGARSVCDQTGSGNTPLGPVPAQGDCTPRSVNQAGPDTPGPGSTDTPARPDANSTGPSASEDATSGTPSETPDEDRPGLLPGLTGGSPSTGSEGDSDSDRGGSSDESSDPPAPGAGGNGSSLPLPLLPPITLPPLLPGMPPITIG